MAIITQPSAFAGQTAGRGMVREEPITESGWLSKVRYDASQMMLTVTLKSGAEYVHYMVYPQQFEDMMQSPSKGSFYAKNIKGKGLSTSVIDKKVGPRSLHDQASVKVQPHKIQGRKHVER